MRAAVGMRDQAGGRLSQPVGQTEASFRIAIALRSSTFSFRSASALPAPRLLQIALATGIGLCLSDPLTKCFLVDAQISGDCAIGRFDSNTNRTVRSRNS
jgi:hypothetical protein